jgi:hypothetical protein
MLTIAFVLFVGFVALNSFNRSSIASVSNVTIIEKMTFIPSSISIPQYTTLILKNKDLTAHAANSIRVYSVDVPWPMGETSTMGNPLANNDANSSGGC